LGIAQGSARDAYRARALNGAGVLASNQEDFETARVVLEESRAIWAELGDSERAGACAHNLASVAMECADYAAAQRLYEEALALQRGDRVREALTLSNLGWLHLMQGDYAQARMISVQSAEMYRGMDDELDAVWCNITIGWAILRSGDALAAQAVLAESLTASSRTRPQSSDTILNCLDGLAAVAAARGDGERALRLAASADHQRRVIGRPASRSQRMLMDSSLQPVREKMNPESAAAAWAAGAALSIDEAINYCLAQDSRV
jgi:ATP/maltotriose-dependent transcriptional regulator MalT